MPKYSSKRPDFVRSLLWLALLCVTLVTAGCMSSARIQNEASVGQQLQDLERSYKAGIISQKEYERLKKAIIRKND